MKLVLFQQGDAGPQLPGLLTETGVVDVSAVVRPNHTPQLVMEGIIDDFEKLRPALGKHVHSATPTPLSAVRLRAPLPRPHKILCAIANYWEHAQRAARPLNMFMKNPDAVVGPGDTIELPAYTDPWIFMHEAELALVMRGPSKMINCESWREAVFGYTCFVDVTARGEGRRTWPASQPMSWLGKSFDTFAPIGPYLVTKDEIADPQEVPIKLWVNGELKQDFNTNDMAHKIPRCIEWISSIHTLEPGDIVATGTNHRGLSAFMDGDVVELECTGLGRLKFNIRDTLQRKWLRETRLDRQRKGQEGPTPQVSGKHAANG
jgi:2-keto-4-pentenoate hydratase/2-oxohepta-3-ene-1,7-dioic acid hydratase in catechol pathway